MMGRTRQALFLLHLVSIAILLLHYHRYVSGLVSILFFAVVVAAAVAAGVGLERARLRAWASIILVGVAVWLIREAGIALLSRIQAARVASGGEGLTAAFDRGLIASTPGIVVAFLATFAVRRRPRLYAWHPALLAPVVVALFWSQGRFNVSIFEHPSILAATVTGFILVEVVLTMIATIRLGRPAVAGGAAATTAGAAAAGAAARLRRRELLPLLVVVLPLLLAALMLLLGRYSEASTAQGGGLIRPTLFRFDFADYINLESEISLSRDLVLLYREEAETAQQQLTMRSGSRLLRRFVLSGYDPRQGFFAEAAPGEDRAPQTVGEGPFSLPRRGYDRRSDLRQEYYLVNFDPSSLVSVNYPVEVVPFEAWSESSFARIYEVSSRASDATPEALADAATPGPRTMGAERHRYYTDYGGNEAIADLAREVTAGIPGDYARARAIERYFHDEFFYSLRPGVAADGDQLRHFLFESRKGYCSYFAFSMTLMARSLGLPSRVAVGFFVDPRMSVMDYYAVRADMAHAWVEIYFEDYGWIEFDPTATTVAPGEEFSMDPNLDMEQISALLEELMEHRNELSPAEPSAADAAGPDGGRGLSAAAVYRFIRRYWVALLAAAYLFAVTAYRLLPRLRATGARDFRGRVRLRFRALLRELDAVGLRSGPGETVAEYAGRLAAHHGLDARACASLYLRALFGEAFADSAYQRYIEEEARLRRGVRTGLPWWRHLLGFLAPYLHLGAPAAAEPEAEDGAGTEVEAGTEGGRR